MGTLVIPALENALQQVNREEIRLNNNNIKESNFIVHYLINILEAELRKDELFSSIFQNYFFGGSFYDHLKVGKADEFDIDLVFAISKIAKPQSDNSYPACVKVRVNSSNPIVTQICIEGYLSVSKVMSWFQSLIDLADRNIKRKLRKKHLWIKKRSISKGPAITFQILDMLNKNAISIDFVPCFKFDYSDWPRNFRRCGTYSDYIFTHEFLVVPKTPNNGLSDNLMRLSFQGQERRLLHDKGHLKPAIRLLKLYRNKYLDLGIKSYYIKTLALWSLQDCTFVYEGKSLGHIFLDLFKRLIFAIRNRQLFYFWNQNFNFFGDLNPEYMTDLCYRMNKHYRVIFWEDTQNIVNIFLRPSTYEEYEDSSDEEDYSDQEEEGYSEYSSDDDFVEKLSFPSMYSRLTTTSHLNYLPPTSNLYKVIQYGIESEKLYDAFSFIPRN